MVLQEGEENKAFISVNWVLTDKELPLEEQVCCWHALRICMPTPCLGPLQHQCVNFHVVRRSYVLA
jgi:hypothetical protein